MTLDLALRGGTLVDGTGARRRRADIGIAGGRIVEIGETVGAARRSIDVSGKIVAPGFIDVHTHYDVQAFWEPALTPSATHGFTTVIGGNCGFSIAPLDPSQVPYLAAMLARVEGMPQEVVERGAPWDWTSFAEFLSRLEGRIGLNAGFMVGHSAIRTTVMGNAAVERAATESELGAMCDLLRQSITAGGFGFSSTRADTHNDANGDPVPSRHASMDEMLALSAVCAEFEGTSLELVPQGMGPFTDESIETMAAMSAAGRRPLNWNVLSVDATNLEMARAKLGAADVAAARGGRVVALTIPMPIVAHFSFLTGFQLDTLPGWAKPMALDPAAKLALLADAEQRETLRRGAATAADPARIAEWGARVIATTHSPATHQYAGRRVGDLAVEQGRDPFDVLVDVVVEDGLHTTFVRDRPAETRADWSARAELWGDPRTVIGASDAGAHLDFFGAFNYSTVMLGEAVRRFEVIELEEAVRHLTAVPAALYGIRDRGVIAEGAWADVVVFDAERVGSGPMHLREDLPGQAPRLYADAEGVEYTFVNGECLVDHGVIQAARPGAILRSGADTRTPSLV